MANRVKEPHKCEHCTKEFYPRKDKLLHGQGTYCSKQCSVQAVGINNLIRGKRGSENPNWKGGISGDNYRYKLTQIKRFPHKIRAGEKLRGAIKAGKIVRMPCEVCGSTEDIHGHHEDYSKPLEVMWLCRKHHREKHDGKLALVQNLT